MTKSQAAINKAARDCRKAFAAHPKATFAWTHWHDTLVSPIPDDEQPERRIEVILTEKSVHEHVVRLRNFRPVIGPLPTPIAKAGANYAKAWANHRKARTGYAKTWLTYDKARTDYDVLCDHEPKLAEQHNREWPDNTWNGANIFPEEKP